MAGRGSSFCCTDRSAGHTPPLAHTVYAANSFHTDANTHAYETPTRGAGRLCVVSHPCVLFLIQLPAGCLASRRQSPHLLPQCSTGVQTHPQPSSEQGHWLHMRGLEQTPWAACSSVTVHCSSLTLPRDCVHLKAELGWVVSRISFLGFPAGHVPVGN